MMRATTGAPNGRQRLYFDPFTVSAFPGFTAGVSKSAALPGSNVIGLVRDPSDTTLYPVNAFGGALTPRTLTPTRGTGGPLPYRGDGTTAELTLAVAAHAFATPTTVWRGFLTHFITAPFAAATPLPPQIAEFGYFSQRTDAYSSSYVALAIYTVDAAGAVVDRLHDLDTALGGGDGLNYTGNRVVRVPLAAGVIPAGGALVVEVFYGVELVHDTTLTTFHFACGGWSDTIPPTGEGDILTLEMLADTCATYIDIAGLSTGTVFDATPDAEAACVVQQSWATAVMAAARGSEQRAMLRDFPGEILELGFGAMSDVATAQLEALLRANDESGYRLPWWPDAQTLGADFALGSSVLPLNTTGIDFIAGGELLFYQRPGVWELATIQSIDSAAQLTLAAGTAALWRQQTLVLPIKRAVLVTDHDVARAAAWVSRAPLTFRVLAG